MRERYTYQITDRLSCLLEKLRRYDIAYLGQLTADCPYIETCRLILNVPEFQETLKAEIER